MPAKNSRLQLPRHVVTAVLVAHDGARWLPATLAALAALSRPPQALVAVDTGSADGSAALLADALGDAAVVHCARDTGFGAAVQAGLQAAAQTTGRRSPRAAERVEWVWLLHDDAAPAPGALLEMLAEAERSPSATVLGPKTVDADGATLREVGVTVDSSGQRRTGLEAGELDQGQHDEVRDVLAVGTAGMLVRRSVWDRLGGLDDSLPLYGDDVDFGWRATAAGERVVVVPSAVVRHAAAVTAGARRPDAAPGRAAARANGLRVVLANTARPLVGLLAVRYVAEALLRAVGLLVLRHPTAAVDEVTAVASVLSRPGRIAAARRSRRPLVVRSHREVRPLLARPGARWPHARDVLARPNSRPAVTPARHARRPVETGPVAAEAESLDLAGGGVVAAVARRPGFLLFAVLAVLAVVAERGLFGDSLHGGRLLPAPGGASDLWSLYVQSFHRVGLGSTVPTPPWVAVIAAVSTVLLGKVWLAVDLLVLGAVPLAGLSAYLAAGALTRSTPVRLWAGAAYAFVPALTGAVSGGRLDVVVSVIAMPLLARAVASAVRTAARRHGYHRAVAAGLLLAVVAAFAPVIWLLTAAILVVAVAVVPGARSRVALAGAVVLAAAAAALVPWPGHLLAHPTLLVAGAGLPEPTRSAHPLSAADLLLLRPGGPAQPPLWTWAPYVAAALLGLARSRGVRAAQVAMSMLVIGVGASVAISRLHGAVPGVPDSRYWTGATAAFAAVGALAAAAVGASGSRAALARHSFGWRQPAAAALAAAAAVATLAAAAGWLVRGADGPLTARDPAVLPVFAAAALSQPGAPQVLVLRSGGGGVVRYALVQRPGDPTLGSADVARPATSADHALTGAVRSAVAGAPDAAAALARFGIILVVAPGQQPSALQGLSNVDGLVRVPTDDAVVWRVSPAAGTTAAAPPADGSRHGWLVGELVVVIVLVLLTVPSARRRHGDGRRA